MGAYDGAEVWESVGTILLEKINEICNKINIGLDRDDVLSIFRNKSGTQLEKTKKKLKRLFKECDLIITLESDQKVFNYLDVTLNLKDGTFRPYHKQWPIQYVHAKYNHPQYIIKHIPAFTGSRLSNLMKYYLKNQQNTTMIICVNLDTIGN